VDRGENMSQYDAIIVVSFGGPDGPDDVIPFLENVVRGKPVPRERLLEVAEHYYHFGGKSPINGQNLALIEALKKELAGHGPDLPIYFGNRNWHPLLPDTLAEMKKDGVKRALAFFTSAFSCYSGCRQYRENIADARQLVGEDAPEIDLLRKFYNHPGFLEPLAEMTVEKIAQLSPEGRAKNKTLFTAHSIPTVMAEHSRYEEQLTESSKLIAQLADIDDWELVYQSRSGPPSHPWLEPDICDRIEELKDEGYRAVTVVPVGFVSDHLEVLFDLDTEAVEKAAQCGLEMARVPTVGVHPKFISMIAELIRERVGLQTERRALGSLGPSYDVCPANCCLYPRSRPKVAAST
jgi:protoporphyrin/coproporphyrin ferrochelatase